MKPRQRQPYPGAEKLKELKDAGLSNVKIAHLHGVSSQTIHRWMVKAGLEGELPSDEPDEQRFSKLVKAQPESEVVEGEVLMDEIDEQKPSIIPASSSTQSALVQSQSSPIRPDEPDTAFEQLSQTQKRAVSILADRPALTGKELAGEVGVSEQTVVAWKQSLVFQDALRELLVPAFRSEALLMVVKDLRRVIDSGKARPEDRKLLAEISGLAAGDQVNVQVNLAQDGFFGRRWR